MISDVYKQYLKSPAWQRKRQQAFAKYGRRCNACRTAKGPLQVHHLNYNNPTNPPLESLIILCVKCHRRVTAYHRRHRAQGLQYNTALVVREIRREISSKKK